MSQTRIVIIKVKLHFQLQKISAVFGAMNMCNVDITQRYLIAECWIPTADVIRVRNNLDKSGMVYYTIIFANYFRSRQSQINVDQISN